MRIFIISFLFPIAAHAFPIWGLCRVGFQQCFDKNYKKVRCNDVDKTQKIVIDSKNVIVQIHRVDYTCAWVSTGPTVLTGVPQKLTCVPEWQCRPLFGSIR